MYPKSRYAAEGVCFECHVAAWQYALHESVELSAGFDSWSRALAGAEHGAHGGSDRCVFGIERMYRDITRRCAVCGRSLHSRFLFCHDFLLSAIVLALREQPPSVHLCERVEIPARRSLGAT